MSDTTHRVWWWLVDHTFPLAEPPQPADQECARTCRADEERAWDERTSAIPQDRLEPYMEGCRRAFAEERDRGQSVDARLTTIIGLSSIAGTIVFGTMLTSAQRITGLLQWLILLTLAYLTVQVASAMLAGVRGLERRSYKAAHPLDLLPRLDESPDDHRRRQVRAFLGVLAQHQEQHNQKVTQMAVAHCAIKNFVAGLLVVALLAVVHRATLPPVTDELVHRLRQDLEVRALLRGPQGPPGTPGIPGPPAPPCPAPQPNAPR